MLYIKLEQLLTERGISHREIARRTGIRHPTISEMCANKARSLPVENLAKLCEALDCDIADILAYRKDPSE